MANKPIFKPLANGYRMKPKRQFLLKPAGSDVFFKGGDYDEFKWTMEIEETEVYSNEFPEKSLALIDITKAEPTISFTARMMTEFLRQVAFLSDKGEIVQSAADGQTKTFQATKECVIRLPHRDVTVDTVTNGAVEYEIDTHYTVDDESGAVDIFAHPAGTIFTDGYTPVTVAFDAAQITSQAAYGLMSKTDIRCSIVFIQNTKWGPQHEVTFHDVQIRPDGDVVMGADGDDFATMGFTGRCYADTSKPSGFELGTIVERPTRA